MTTTDSLLHSPAARQWQKIGIRQHHGVNIPLFSLHSESSCGIGEYPDLIPLVKWCHETGFDVIQLLPLNDTGVNPSPYSSISAFALNPIHLGLAKLPNLEQYPELLALLPAMQARNSLQRVDYLSVGTSKDDFLRKYYQTILTTTPHFISGSTDFKFFVQQNDWLYPFALFKALKIHYNWASWTHWEPVLQNISKELYQQLLSQYSDEISYHIFVQYFCFQQMKDVKYEAEKFGVFIKGDIPILIDRESADVWFNRSLFHMEYSAGSPPDMYSDEGQNWGSPIYNWSEIEKENYSWWKKRLAVADEIYHLYRIDHIVGFYRIWAIPAGSPGRDGMFIPQDARTWIALGERMMREMLVHCMLLPIGEDLGAVPSEVRDNLRSLGICGTKVVRWERMWNEDRRFIPFNLYPVDSMTTVSTHDSEPLQLWWKNNPEEAGDFSRFMNWTYTPDLTLAHHEELMSNSHKTGSLFHINLLQEYLVLVPGMTWPNPEDERVNVPGIVSDRNWSYRFKPSVEEIISSPSLCKIMRNMASFHI